MTHGKDVEPLLLAEMAEECWRLSSACVDIGTKTDTENPILLNAWNAYPWPTRKGRGDGQSSATPTGNG